MIPSDKPESLVRFIEQLDETFPEYKFEVTPAIYDPDTSEPIRGIMARTHGGKLRKLRLVLRGGMKSDIAWSMFFSPAPTKATISEIERDVVRAYIQEIREELYPA